MGVRKPAYERYKGDIDKRKLNIWRNVRKKAKLRNIPFDITVDDIQWSTRCPILGIELDYWTRGVHTHNTVSVDRIDSSKGYIPGNVAAISYRANNLKNNATRDELVSILKYMDLMTPQSGSNRPVE
jgi:hypothetical protein